VDMLPLLSAGPVASTTASHHRSLVSAGTCVTIAKREISLRLLEHENHTRHEFSLEAVRVPVGGYLGNNRPREL